MVGSYIQARRINLFTHTQTRVTRLLKMVNVLVALATGCEELETVGIVDTLVRGGANVTVASIENGKTVKCSRGITMVADELLKECIDKSYDCIALPGGLMGAEHFKDCAMLVDMLKKQKAENRWIAAICASPAFVLENHGLLDGEKAVCYPALMEKIKPTNRGTGRVCVSNKIVTSVGPSSAIELGLKLVEVLFNSEAAKSVGEGMLVVG